MYFRSETGGLLLLGKSFDNDPVGYDFCSNDQIFYQEIWPKLTEIVPDFDRLKLLRSWAGLYAVNRFDGNAVLGEYPELKGFWLVNGFSGHGLQQAPAVGRYIAEKILRKSVTLDLSVFNPKRILNNQPLQEAHLI